MDYLILLTALVLGFTIGYFVAKDGTKSNNDMMQRCFDETMNRVSEQMRNATGEMLRQRQMEFSETSHQEIGEIVSPLRDTIERMRRAMDDNTMQQTAMSTEMRVNLENMMRYSEAARRSTDELARVFRHGNKVQGDWGETVLDELLQAQGLTRGIHYDTQTIIRDAQGHAVQASGAASNLRPDVILHLDQRRELIVDAKVSLSAYMDYVNADTEEKRQTALAAHVNSINRHVHELAKKDYTSYIQSPKLRMDYVVMFVPNTGALWTALHYQPDLWRRAMERGVFIADEQTLFAALRIIDLTWTQITQAEQHEKVYKLAEEMLDRVGQFCRKYAEVGRALENATNAYHEGQKKLDPQGQSILGTANKLIKLGAKQSQRNPLPPEAKMVEESD